MNANVLKVGTNYPVHLFIPSKMPSLMSMVVSANMYIELTKSFSFEAAHWLPTFPQDHKCRRMHGHSFHVDVVVAGNVDESRGYLIDYGEIKAAIAPVRVKLDHYLLNEIEGLENPTAEMLARWIFDRLKPALPLLAAVRVHETCTTEATYRGT